MFTSKIARKLWLVPAFVTLAGCAGVRYPSYYVLNPPALIVPTAASKPVFGPVVLREFDAPAFLKEGAIAYRESSTQLGFYNYHRWASDPRQAVSTAMVRELRACGSFRSATQFDGHGSADWVVTGFIDHMEEVDVGSDVSVEVAVSAQLANEKTGEVVWQGSSLRIMSVDRRSVPGIVALMSQGTSAVVKELVNSLQDRVRDVSRSTP